MEPTYSSSKMAVEQIIKPETEAEEIDGSGLIEIVIGVVGGILAILTIIISLVLYAFDRDEDKEVMRKKLLKFCCLGLCLDSTPPPSENERSNNGSRREAMERRHRRFRSRRLSFTSNELPHTHRQFY